MFVLARKSKRTARSCNKSGSTGSTARAGVGLSEDSRSLSLPQTRLVFSSFFTHTGSCWSSGEGESGFPANFFSRKRACLLLERANAEGEFLFFRRRLTGFTVARSATSLSSLALFGVLAGSLQLTVNDNESWFRVSFHEYRLSSSFSSLFRTSMIDFGIILGRASIIIFQKSRWQEFSVHSIRHYSSGTSHRAKDSFWIVSHVCHCVPIVLDINMVAISKNKRNYLDFEIIGHLREKSISTNRYTETYYTYRIWRSTHPASAMAGTGQRAFAQKLNKYLKHIHFVP